MNDHDERKLNRVASLFRDEKHLSCCFHGVVSKGKTGVFKKHSFSHVFISITRSRWFHDGTVWSNPVMAVAKADQKRGM